MHKYQPRVHVIRKDFSSELSPTKPVPTGEGVKTFSFPETVFTTVTAYQNQQVHYWLSVYSTTVTMKRIVQVLIGIIQLDNYRDALKLAILDNNYFHVMFDIKILYCFV